MPSDTLMHTHLPPSVAANIRLGLTLGSIVLSAMGGIFAYAYKQGDADSRFTAFSKTISELQEGARVANARLDALARQDDITRNWHDDRLASDARAEEARRQVVVRLDTLAGDMGKVRENMATEHERLLFLTDRVTALRK